MNILALPYSNNVYEHVCLVAPKYVQLVSLSKDDEIRTMYAATSEGICFLLSSNFPYLPMEVYTNVFLIFCLFLLNFLGSFCMLKALTLDDRGEKYTVLREEDC